MLATQAPASTPARSRRASSSAPAASPSKPKRRTPRAGSRAATPVPTVKDFVEECKNLGKTRFIVIGDGAILECVNTFSQVSYNSVPERGTLATISSADKTFECHIQLAKIREAKLAKGKARAGDWDTYATRFYGDGGRLLLTCLMHGAGKYDPTALHAWGQLAAKYGETITFAAAE